MFAGTLCGRGVGGRAIEKAACGLRDRRGERGSRSKLLWGVRLRSAGVMGLNVQLDAHLWLPARSAASA